MTRGALACTCVHLRALACTYVQAMMIGSALAKNTTLEELYLHYTAIGDQGLDHLVEMLKTNKALKKLECGNCGISSAGAARVIAMLKQGVNSTIIHFGLFGNADDMSDEVATINELVLKNKQ